MINLKQCIYQSILNILLFAGVIEMYDWYERKNCYILVMERPHPVMDLFDYLNKHEAMSESLAKTIFRQVACSFFWLIIYLHNLSFIQIF